MDLKKSGLIWTAQMRRRLTAHNVDLDCDQSKQFLTSRRGNLFVLLSNSVFLHDFVIQRWQQPQLASVVGQLLFTSAVMQASSMAAAHFTELLPVAERLAAPQAPPVELSRLLLPRDGIAELRSVLSAWGLATKGMLPSEVCLSMLPLGTFDDGGDRWALAVSWLVHHDMWFARICHDAVAAQWPAGGAPECWRPDAWHADEPAAALHEAVILLRAVAASNLAHAHSKAGMAPQALEPLLRQAAAAFLEFTDLGHEGAPAAHNHLALRLQDLGVLQ
jgi:hypothetical protein